MKLKINALGIAGGAITAIGYLLCGIWYWISPGSMIKVSNYTALNMDFTPIMGTGATWDSFVVGLIVWTVSAYVCCIIFGWIYNKLAD